VKLHKMNQQRNTHRCFAYSHSEYDYSILVSVVIALKLRYSNLLLNTVEMKRIKMIGLRFRCPYGMCSCLMVMFQL